MTFEQRKWLRHEIDRAKRQRLHRAGAIVSPTVVAPRACLLCGGPVPVPKRMYRWRRYCGDACKVRALSIRATEQHNARRAQDGIRAG